MSLENFRGEVLDGKYRIERQLGKGGMGTVYLATHIGTERPVALKVIASEYMDSNEFVERFRREARAAGRLRHPNVVDVTDFGFSETAGNGTVAYLVMEYLDGCTLGEILEEEKRIPLEWTIDIIEQVCSAVHEAHHQGIIHRDLKPDNIWLEPNQRGGYTIKVLDFGIAKLEESPVIQVEESGPDATPVSAGTRRIDQAQTLTGNAAGETLALPEKQTSTLVTESPTLASENQTREIDSEAGTMIQTGEPNSESGTAILPSPAADATPTKLVSDSRESDDRRKNRADSTAQPLISDPVTKELTKVGAVLGTPLYMSPEQCRGEGLTRQSDIYSMGVIIYQMLSGKTPFAGDYVEVMEAHKKYVPDILKAKGISKRVSRVVHNALAKDPAERPATAEAFASELRASSEGIGRLLQRALVIYSERLPKFLLISLLLAIPSIGLTVTSVAFRFLVAGDVIENNLLTGLIAGFIGILTFFVNIFYSALLVGMTTWIVAQKLAIPLRPISIRAAFRRARECWKSLLGTVTLSTLVGISSWGAGFIVGGVVSLVLGLPVYYLSGRVEPAIGIGLIFGILGAIVIGVSVSGLFMLISPAIMMEKISGLRAFRRSAELARRSFRTVFATSFLAYFVPFLLAIAMSIAIAGIINAVFPKENSEDKPPATAPAEAGTAGQKKDDKLNIKLGEKGLEVTKTEKDVSVVSSSGMASDFRGAAQQGLFELLWLPIIVIMLSFTSVITALLYFKTRQAGGETMRGLLEQFEEVDKPLSNWQKRVRQKILESGKSTGGRKIVAGE